MVGTNGFFRSSSFIWYKHFHYIFNTKRLKLGCTLSPAVNNHIARIVQCNINSQADYCTFDWPLLWRLSNICLSLSLKEWGEAAECARRPLFSIVLSRGLMIHVLIHVLCRVSRYPCSQYWIIKALCACRSRWPSFVLSLLSGSHSLSFCILLFLPRSPNSSISAWWELIHSLTYNATKKKNVLFQTWQLSHWLLCCSKVVFCTVLWLWPHLCYIASVAGHASW